MYFKMNYKVLFIQYLEQQNVLYSTPQDNAVLVTYNGDNLKKIPIYVFFDKDGDPYVCMKCWDVAKIADEKYEKGLMACNALNQTYRWVKFYIDEDKDVIVQSDTFVDELTCGEECLILVKRMVSIIDEGYPTLMQKLWS